MTSLASLSEDKILCKRLLPKVSRTFALNIGMLSGTLYWAVLDGYLLCRILDTIEDAPNLSPLQKKTFLYSFLAELKNTSYNVASLQAWIKETAICQAVPAEKELLEHSESVLRLYFSLPQNIQAAMLPPIIRMGEGMAEFAQKQVEGITQLTTEKELELYCYYVAGTVGEMLTALFQSQLGNRPTNDILEKFKIDFGLGLQLTNILKDYGDDSKRNWCYIPQSILKTHQLDADTFFSKRFPERNQKVLIEMIRKTGRYLQHSLDYTLAIPFTAFRLRWFCALPLFLAVDTLVMLKNGLKQPNPSNKVSRGQVKRLLMILPWVSFSDQALRKCFNDRLAPIFEPLEEMI